MCNEPSNRSAQIIRAEEIQRQIQSGEEVFYENTDIEAWGTDISDDQDLAAPVCLKHCTVRGGEHSLPGCIVQPDTAVTFIRGVSESKLASIKGVQIEEALDSGDSIALVNVTVIGSVHRWNSRQPIQAGAFILENCSLREPSRALLDSMHIAEVDFTGPVCLDGVRSEGGISMVNNTFRCSFDLKAYPSSDPEATHSSIPSRIERRVKIAQSVFHSDAELDSVGFRQGLEIRDCEFRGKLVFFGSSSGRQLSFQGNDFLKEASFKGQCDVQGNWVFDGSRFRRGASFEEGVLQSDVSLEDCTIAGRFELPRRHWTTRSWVHRLLKWNDGLPSACQTSVSGTNVSDCSNLLFRRWVQDTNYVEQFRKRHAITHGIWFVMADCGRSAWPWLFWVTLIVASFACVYYHQGHGLFPESGPARLGRALLYSVSTMTSSGSDALSPHSLWESIAVQIQHVFGYIMLGGLISIFAEKMIRKS